MDFEVLTDETRYGKAVKEILLSECSWYSNGDGIESRNAMTFIPAKEVIVPPDNGIKIWGRYFRITSPVYFITITGYDPDDRWAEKEIKVSFI